MSASLLQTLKTGAPPPKVLLLPAEFFFVRSIDVTGALTTEEVRTRVELALETLSPFPVAQLLHGFHWVEGSPNALVFAAYRRRFSADEVDSWAGLDWVAPSFCAYLAYPAKERSALLYRGESSMTLIQWGQGTAVPEQVLTRALPAEATDEQLDAVRAELVSTLDAACSIKENFGVPTIERSEKEGIFNLRAEACVIELSRSQAALQDIRSTEVLEGLRYAGRRDQALWRVACGGVALLAVLLLVELGIFGFGFVLKAKQLQVNVQKPVVSKIESSHALAFRIDELANKRLLPFEMITIVSQQRPPTILFVRTTASISNPGIYAIRVEAQTPSAADIPVFQKALGEHPAIASVEVSDLRSDRVTTFTLVVKFKPEVLKPAASRDDNPQQANP